MVTGMVSTVAGNGGWRPKGGSLHSAGFHCPEYIALLHHTAATATFAVGEDDGVRVMNVMDTGVTKETLTRALIDADAAMSTPIGAPKPLWGLITEYAFEGHRFIGHVSEVHHWPGSSSISAIVYEPLSETVYIANSTAIWKCPAQTFTSDSVTLVAGNVGTRGDSDGAAADARFSWISTLCLDADREHLLIGESDSGRGKLRRLNLRTGAVITLRSNVACRGLALDPSSIAAGDTPCDVLIERAEGGLWRFNRRIGSLRYIELSPDPDGVFAMCATPSGALIGFARYCVRILDPFASPPHVRLLAGNPMASGFADGKADDARFHGSGGIALWGRRLFVADYWNHRIRCVDLSESLVEPLNERVTNARTSWPPPRMVVEANYVAALHQLENAARSLVHHFTATAQEATARIRHLEEQLVAAQRTGTALRTTRVPAPAVGAGSVSSDSSPSLSNRLLARFEELTAQFTTEAPRAADSSRAFGALRDDTRARICLQSEADARAASRTRSTVRAFVSVFY